MDEKTLGQSGFHDPEEPGNHELSSLPQEERVSAQEPSQAVVVKDLQNQITLLKAKISVDRLDLPRMAEDKLEEIQTIAIELANLVTQITHELYQSAPHRYQMLVGGCKAKMKQMELLLITFEATVEIEYPKISFFQKLAITLIALVRNSISEATLMRTLSSAPAKRKALLEASQKFRAQMENMQTAISEEEQRPVNQKMHELLMQNQQYQSLISEIRTYEADLEMCSAVRVFKDSIEINPVLNNLYSHWVESGEAGRYVSPYKKKLLINNVITSKLAELRKNCNDLETSARIQAEKQLKHST